MDLFSAIAELFKYFASWAPYPMKILTTQRAVKFRTVSWFLMNRKDWWLTPRFWTSPVPEPEILYPGFYWYIPAITYVIEFVAIEDIYVINPKPAMTKDKREVSIWSVLECKVSGPKTAATKVESVSEKIKSAGLRANQKAISDFELDDIDIDDLQRCVVKYASDALSGYGVTVIDATVGVSLAEIKHHVGLMDEQPIILEE